MRLILLQINQKKLLFTCKVFVYNYVIADFDFFYKMEPFRPDMDVKWDTFITYFFKFFEPFRPRLAIIKVSKKY
jgi:hypothetical protein